MILLLILAPPTLGAGGTCPHLPSPSYDTGVQQRHQPLARILSESFYQQSCCFLERCRYGFSGPRPRPCIIPAEELWAENLRDPQGRSFCIRGLRGLFSSMLVLMTFSNTLLRSCVAWFSGSGIA